MTSVFYKSGDGGEERNDRLVKIGKSKWLLIFGHYEDEDGLKYHYRKKYDHKPSKEELKGDVEGLVNAITDQKILTGFKWNDKKVWLSLENQINFRAQYDLCVQTDGASLPVKLKLGEDEDGNGVYHTFEGREEFSEFYAEQVTFVYDTLAEAWNEKEAFTQKLKEMGVE